MLNTLIHHCEAVLHLRFNNGMMVTCSKDRSIAVWDMASPTDITLRRVLVGHRAAVNVVDFDDKYIVSASGDRTIKVRCFRSFLFAACSTGVFNNQEQSPDREGGPWQLLHRYSFRSSVLPAAHFHSFLLC